MKSFLPPFKHCALSVAVASFFLIGCGGGSGGQNSTTSPTPVPAPAPAPTPSPAPAPGYTAVAATADNTLSTGGCADTALHAGAFSDVSRAAGLCYDVASDTQDSIPARVGGGIAVSDFDADGDLDIYVTHGRNQAAMLLTLNSSLQFTDITAESGVAAVSTEHAGYFLDLDQDGDQDLIAIQESAPYIQFFANQGEADFDDISHLLDISLSKVTYSMAAGDIDLDGDLDLFFAHWDPENEQSRWEFLWQQQGPGQYLDISDTVELEPFGVTSDGVADQFSFTPIFADVNQDRFPDLLLAADWGTSQYLVNTAGTGFVDYTIPVVVSDRAGMGATTADYDNDGDLDWFVSAIGDTREEFLTIGLFDGNRLYQNDGQGNFLNLTDYAGVRQGYWAWGACFADVNNDGYEDLFVVNGYNGWTQDQQDSGNFDKFESTKALLYINRQDGTFVEQAVELGIEHTAMGRGLVCYDYDRDGDIDLMVANSGASPTLYRNDSAAADSHFVNIRLHGLAGNPDAVGATIHVTAGGITQMRELQLGGQYLSQNPIEAHFGLAGNTQITQIRVQWPGTAYKDTIITDAPVDHFLTIRHPALD